MTKAEICKQIKEKTGLDNVSVQAVVEAFMETVKETLADGKAVYLRGFGTFELKHRAEKTARNISKNTTIVIPEHDIPHFRPARDFEKMVSGQAE